MSKIKSAKYWQEQIMYGEPLAIDTIRQIQKQAIEATLEVAARDACLSSETTSVYQGSLGNENGNLYENETEYSVDKYSILSLISSEDLKVE